MPRPKKPESEKPEPTCLKFNRELKAWWTEYARAHGRSFTLEVHRVLDERRRSIEASRERRERHAREAERFGDTAAARRIRARPEPESEAG